MQETSVIQLDGESKVALVFGQMNEPPGARARVALTGLTVAEVSSDAACSMIKANSMQYFRDEEGWFPTSSAAAVIRFADLFSRSGCAPLH